MTSRHASFALLPLLALAACGQSTEEQPPAAPETQAPLVTPAPTASPERPPLVPPGEEVAGVAAIGPAGYGPYVIGEPIAESGQGAPEEVTPRLAEDCRLYSDPDQPGLDIMTDGQAVTRVSIAAPSTLLTAAGIGIGDQEAEVRAVYPELRQERHERMVAPGKNLYTSAADDDGLRFEIGPRSTVIAIHAGSPPFLGYTDCAER